MRRPSARALPDACDIGTIGRTQNARHEWVEGSFTAAHSSVPCRFEPLSKRESERTLGETMEADYICWVPHTLVGGTEIGVGKDSIVRFGGVLYEATGGAIDQGGQGVVLGIPLKPRGANR